MPRTTLNIDAPILRDLKKIQKERGKSLGRVVSDLLATALASHRKGLRRRRPFRWIARPLHAQVDLTDEEAVRVTLEEGQTKQPGRAEKN